METINYSLIIISCLSAAICMFDLTVNIKIIKKLKQVDAEMEQIRINAFLQANPYKFNQFQDAILLNRNGFVKERNVVKSGNSYYKQYKFLVTSSMYKGDVFVCQETDLTLNNNI